VAGYIWACAGAELVLSERLGTGSRMGCSLTTCGRATGGIVLGCLLSRFAGGSVTSSSGLLLRVLIPTTCLPESGDIGALW